MSPCPIAFMYKKEIAIKKKGENKMEHQTRLFNGRISAVMVGVRCSGGRYLLVPFK